MFKSKELEIKIKSLPERPGSYQYYNFDGNIIYIGKAKNLKKRVLSYFTQDQNKKTTMLVSKIADIKYIVVNTEEDALLLENNLIKKYKPYYNILLKDDKTYPSICITNEEFPRVIKTRKIIKKAGIFFGPYSHIATLHSLLELADKLFNIRQCQLALNTENIKRGKYKVCLKYHIGKCNAPCIGKQKKEEYLNNIESFKKILKGKTEEVKKILKEEMLSLAEEMNFEAAQKIKEKLVILENYQSKSEVVSTSINNIDVFNIENDVNKAYINFLHITNGNITQAYTTEIKKKIDESDEEILIHCILELRERFNSNAKEIVVPFEMEIQPENITFTIPQKGDKKKLLELSKMNVRQYKFDRLKQEDKLNPAQRNMRLMKDFQNLLQLPKAPIQIELFDNSNISGTSAVAACVVFKEMRPSKKDYRKYNIKTVIGSDDYASMEEVVKRRYSRAINENTPLPDLIITDGGKGQMECVRKVIEDELHLNIPIAGLAKDDKHHTNELLFGFPPKTIALDTSGNLFKLLTRMQDEVHRFAISFHRDKRSKQQTKSKLDKIIGVGPITQKILLQKFKSLKRIERASIEEIQNLLGKIKGEKIYNELHNNNI